VEPREGTVERWAWDYVRSTSLAHKLSPPPRPERWEDAPPPRRIEAPGRPPELSAIERPPKTPRPGALRDPLKRAQLVHTFFHHELQAAELMAWAFLAFPDAPHELRRGLLRIADDEVRHARMYAEHLARLGSAVGAFGVRDWFWERVSSVRRLVELVALLGIGFEGGNLDHSARFAAAFREAGDEEGARLQEIVGAEEVVGFVRSDRPVLSDPIAQMDRPHGREGEGSVSHEGQMQGVRGQVRVSGRKRGGERKPADLAVPGQVIRIRGHASP